jgi:hypothetical protein
VNTIKCGKLEVNGMEINMDGFDTAMLFDEEFDPDAKKMLIDLMKNAGNEVNVVTIFNRDRRRQK